MQTRSKQLTSPQTSTSARKPRGRPRKNQQIQPASTVEVSSNASPSTKESELQVQSKPQSTTEAPAAANSAAQVLPTKEPFTAQQSLPPIAQSSVAEKPKSRTRKTPIAQPMASIPAAPVVNATVQSQGNKRGREHDNLMPSTNNHYSVMEPAQMLTVQPNQMVSQGQAMIFVQQPKPKPTRDPLKAMAARIAKSNIIDQSKARLQTETAAGKIQVTVDQDTFLTSLNKKFMESCDLVMKKLTDSIGKMVAASFLKHFKTFAGSGTMVQYAQQIDAAILQTVQDEIDAAVLNSGNVESINRDQIAITLAQTYPVLANNNGSIDGMLKQRISHKLSVQKGKFGKGEPLSAKRIARARKLQNEKAFTSSVQLGDDNLVPTFEQSGVDDAEMEADGYVEDEGDESNDAHYVDDPSN